MQQQSEQVAGSYVKPEVTTLGDEELIESLGPALAYSGNFPFGF